MRDARIPLSPYASSAHGLFFLKLKNIAVILGALLGVFGAALALGAPMAPAGRDAIAGVFVVTALGHFLQSRQMVALLPAGLPARHAVVLLSGLLELGFAWAVVIPRWSVAAGVAIAVFLVLVSPLNILAAVRKVDFGGHGSGTRYLWIRLPLQVLLLAWTYWFAIRG